MPKIYMRIVITKQFITNFRFMEGFIKYKCKSFYIKYDVLDTQLSHLQHPHFHWLINEDDAVI